MYQDKSCHHHILPVIDATWEWHCTRNFVAASAVANASAHPAHRFRHRARRIHRGPPGYAAGGLLGKNLTTAELASVAHLHGVTSIDESLHGAAQTD
jgi:hypothetical protein